MILFDQGGEGRGGRKRSWSKVLPVLPPVNPWSACFSFFFRSSNFEFPARIKKKKNWREIHPLDPLKVGTFCIVVLLIVALAATGLIRSKEFPGGSVQWLPV
jgi:hypothetical protein